VQLLISTVPVLPARDMDRTLEYYRRLGFELYKRFGDDIRVRDADALYAEFLQKSVERMIPPANKPWLMRELNIVDPDGNLLRFGQKIIASAADS
jgi:catechol 2,3-dioxygenase-like lactoylglutathione lyase family enzyme